MNVYVEDQSTRLITGREVRRCCVATIYAWFENKEMDIDESYINGLT